MVLEEEFLFQIYALIEEIPKGKVATYGQIASLSGHDKKARMVGAALKRSILYGYFPCHRVVNHLGRLAPAWHEQRLLLEQEGIIFKENGCVDLKRCQWNNLEKKCEND